MKESKSDTAIFWVIMGVYFIILGAFLMPSDKVCGMVKLSDSFYYTCQKVN